MKYTLQVVPSAQRQFRKLAPQLQDRIAPKLINLGHRPHPFGSQKLRDTHYYRIRIGDYRIIYSIDDAHKVIKILDVAHRREVYH